MTYIIQTTVDVVKAARHLQSFFNRDQMADDSLVLKTMLTEAFGGPVIRPWAVHSIRDGKATLVGYANVDADEANSRRALALPSVQAAVGEAVGARLPQLKDGDHYRFSVTLVPTIRVTKSEDGPRYGERDAYLVEIDRGGGTTDLSRDEVYRRYLQDRLAGGELLHTRLAGFRLLRMTRPGKERAAVKTMPEAVLEGVLRVTEGASLVTTMTEGVGRQRAYGFGMMRLQPETHRAVSGAPSA